MSLELLIPCARPSRVQEAVDALRAFMRSVEHDRLTLLTILSHGQSMFRNVMREQTRGLAVDDAMIDLVWGWMYARRGVNPEVEREWLELEARNKTWKDQAIEREVERIELAARHNLRIKGDQHFDGEKITIGEDDPRLPSKG